MNKARITGGVLIIIGLTLIYIIDYNGLEFIGGATLGVGLGFLLTGRFSSKTKC